MNRSQKIIFIAIIVLVLTGTGFLAACNFPQKAAPVEVSVFETSLVDSRFLSFYYTLGGEVVLGLPISPLINEGEQECQYTMNVKMCVMTGRVDAEAYFLAPVVVEGELLPTSAKPTVGQSTGEVVNGFVIHPEFVDLYQRLYGTMFAGQPLGNAQVNYDKGRVEQYFENIVIAQDITTQNTTPYLLPVAHAVCTHSCELPVQTQVFIPRPQENSSPFSTFLTEINGLDYGEPLTKPFINADGLQVQIFEYIAIAAHPQDLSNAWLLPLSYELGMYQTEPSVETYGENRDVYFYPVGDKGYHVPIWFDTFIKAHGDRSVSGNPIAEITYYDETPRQCFENYCLDLVQDSLTGQPAVELVPLGAWYLDQELMAGRITEDILLREWVKADTIQFSIGEQYPMVNRQTSQVIYLSVLSTETGKPLSGISSRVTLLTSNNERIELGLMKTNGQGTSWVNVPPHTHLENGTVMRYEVCLELVSGEEVCEVNAYLVKD